MKKILFLALAAGSLGEFAFMFVYPVSALRTEARAPVLIGAHEDAKVRSIVERVCQNCHSSNTEWPLYSRAIPFSSMIESDVRAARAQMNLSRWPTYDDGEKRQLLAEIGSVVRNRVMPPRRYSLLHPEARLSDREIGEIYQWTRSERAWLNKSPGVATVKRPSRAYRGESRNMIGVPPGHG